MRKFAMKAIALACMAAAAALVFAPAYAQQNHLVVTKTLVSNSAHRECMGVTDKQLLRFWYRSDAPIDFNIQYVENNDTLYPVKQTRQSIGSGSFTPKASGDYCMVWTNTSRRPVLFRFEIARLAR
jgi:hypothetical protein